MDWLQNSNIWAKTRMVLISLALLLAASFVLTQINWQQLSHAINVVQAKTPPPEPVETADVSDSVLPAVPTEDSEPAIQAPPIVPASDHASPVAVAATTCAAQKQAENAKYDAAVNAENDKYKANKNKISDGYSARGMAFSSAQKKAQKAESERHSKVLKQLEQDHQKALEHLNC